MNLGRNRLLTQMAMSLRLCLVAHIFCGVVIARAAEASLNSETADEHLCGIEGTTWSTKNVYLVYKDDGRDTVVQGKPRALDCFMGSRPRNVYFKFEKQSYKILSPLDSEPQTAAACHCSSGSMFEGGITGKVRNKCIKEDECDNVIHGCRNLSRYEAHTAIKRLYYEIERRGQAQKEMSVVSCQMLHDSDYTLQIDNAEITAIKKSYNEGILTTTGAVQPRVACHCTDASLFPVTVNGVEMCVVHAECPGKLCEASGKSYHNEVTYNTSTSSVVEINCAWWRRMKFIELPLAAVGTLPDLNGNLVTITATNNRTSCYRCPPKFMSKSDGDHDCVSEETCAQESSAICSKQADMTFGTVALFRVNVDGGHGSKVELRAMTCNVNLALNASGQSYANITALDAQSTYKGMGCKCKNRVKIPLHDMTSDATVTKTKCVEPAQCKAELVIAARTTTATLANTKDTLTQNATTAHSSNDQSSAGLSTGAKISTSVHSQQTIPPLQHNLTTTNHSTSTSEGLLGVGEGMGIFLGCLLVVAIVGLIIHMAIRKNKGLPLIGIGYSKGKHIKPEADPYHKEIELSTLDIDKTLTMMSELKTEDVNMGETLMEASSKSHMESIAPAQGTL